MPKDSSCINDSSALISIRNDPVRSEKPAVGRLSGNWPFTVQSSSAPVNSPAADSSPLTRKEISHFIT